MSILGVLFLFLASTAQGGPARTHSFRTNALDVTNAPASISQRDIQKLTDFIEERLEWSIRRVRVRFYQDTASFQRANKLANTLVDAFTAGADSSVHISSQVPPDMIRGVLAHELVHVVVNQKYRDAIPPWLEEGLANHLSLAAGRRLGFQGRGRIDYKRLAAAKGLTATGLSHPLGTPGSTLSADDVRLRYAASTALMEMISSRCDAQDLLQLAVGKRLEPYIRNTCGIEDLDQAFRDWLQKKR